MNTCAFQSRDFASNKYEGRRRHRRRLQIRRHYRRHSRRFFHESVGIRFAKFPVTQLLRNPPSFDFHIPTPLTRPII